jgi:hypothetical protein
MYHGQTIGAIKRAVEDHIHPLKGRSDFYVNYGNWYVGITNNVTLRRIQHQKSKKIPALHFRAWNANSKINAIEVEKHFHGKGMKDKACVEGARDTTTYIYVFKIRTNIVDDLAYMFGILK